MITKERRREISRNWARKNYAENRKEVLMYHKNYWKTTSPKRRFKRKQKNLRYIHSFRKKNPDSPQIYFTRSKKKWTNGIDCRNPKIWRTAELKAKILLKRIGYQNLFQPDFKFFYFDIVSKNKRKYTVFQITTLRNRAIKKKHIEMAKYFNWDFYIIHVKPNFKEIYLTKINLNIPSNQKTFCYNYLKGQKY